MGIVTSDCTARLKVLTTSLVSLPQKIQVLEEALAKLKSKLPQKPVVAAVQVEEPVKKTKTAKKK